MESGRQRGRSPGAVAECGRRGRELSTGGGRCGGQVMETRQGWGGEGAGRVGGGTRTQSLLDRLQRGVPDSGKCYGARRLPRSLSKVRTPWWPIILLLLLFALQTS